MRKGLVFGTLLLLLGCGGGGSTSSGTTGSSSSSSSSGGGLNFNSSFNNGSTLPGGGSTNGRVLELVNKLLSSNKVLQEEIRAVALADDDAENPQVSPDGRFVAFVSKSNDLVAGDTNNATDIFVRDRANGVTVRVNYDPNDPRTQNGAGEYFFSDDLNWLVFNIPTQPPTSLGNKFLLKNVQTGETFEGQGFLGGISADGRYVSYWRGPNPTHPYLFDRVANQIIDMTPGTNGDSIAWRFSPDGSRVYFYSEASNLVPSDTNGVGDVFTYRLSDGLIERISVKGDGTELNGKSIPGESSSDGRYYAFPSEASNVVSGDTNGVNDIFVKDMQTGQITLVSKALSGAANGDSQSASISADGKLIVFNSKASNLIEKDTNNFSDVFLYNRETQTLLGRVSLNDQRKEITGGGDLFRICNISRDGKWITFLCDAANVIKGTRAGLNVYITNTVIPELFQPPGPHANPYELTFTGAANIDGTPFNVQSPLYVQGGLEPQAAAARRVSFRVGISSPPWRRELTVDFNRPVADLKVGDQVELPDNANASEVRFNQMDPNLQVASRPYINGSGGILTITSLTPGAGTSGTVGIRFDDVEMVPDSSVANNPATGAFKLNGTITVNIP